jgi:hypothetical protein
LSDFENMLQGKFNEMETIKTLFEELDVPYYINEALWIKIREYNRKYFTLESLELMFSYF